MSEGPTRQRSRATFADVWPTAPSTPKTTESNPKRQAQPNANPGIRDIAPAAPAMLVSARGELTGRSRPAETERTIATRDQRISTETMEGRLLGHGTARYRFQPTETPSYYARLLTLGGVMTLWGRGLAQAIAQSKTNVRVGDRVVFRRLDRDPQTGRVQWRAEKPEWFVTHDKEARRRRDEQLAAERAAQGDPDLARAFLSIKAAEALAQRRLSDPQQRLRFIAGAAARLRERVQRERPGLSTELHTEGQGTSSGAPRPRGDREPDRTR